MNRYGLYDLYMEAAAARYAPAYTLEQFRFFWIKYQVFSCSYGGKLSLGRRALSWLCPPLALALPPRGKSGVALLLLLLCLVPAGDAQQGGDSPDALYTKAIEAQIAENWEGAIRFYTEGAERYPADFRFSHALGNLYYDRRLYGLAWDQYRRTEALLPDDTDLLLRLSKTAGYLNNDRVSAEYLERLLAIDEGNQDAIGHLGWMYYKLHRLKDGEALLLDALNRFGPDPDFFMTLGTIYSDLIRYDEAKKYYLDSIEGAELLRNHHFIAVAHYNLSILESRFYHFNLAFEETDASIKALDRSSGRLARGELYLRRLDFSRVFEDYEIAYQMDTQGLSKESLANAYQLAGRLDEARAYAEDCLAAGDLSWMLNYGIDPVEYRRNLYEILYKTYTGLAEAEAFAVYGSPKERAQGMFRRLSYWFKSKTHTLLFRKYSLMAADAYEAAYRNRNPDVLLKYYDAFSGYPRRALTYLRQARMFETPQIPQAEASYDLEDARLLGDRERLREALSRFDPVWERDMIAEAYTELAQGSDRDAAERLFALNRGALRQAGIRLPIDIEIFGAIEVSGAADAGAKLRPMLGALGLEPCRPELWAARFQLSIRITGDSALCELRDRGRGVEVFSRTIPLASLSVADLRIFARSLADAVFEASPNKSVSGDQ
jgi:tetratricopeptide (TPR) repeat protein